MPALTVNSVEVAFAYDAAARATPAEQLDSLVDSGYIVLPAGNLLPAILPPAHIKTAADMGAAWNGPAGSHGVQYKVLRYIFAKVVKFSDPALTMGIHAALGLPRFSKLFLNILANNLDQSRAESLIDLRSRISSLASKLSDAERAVDPADFLAYQAPVSGTFMDYIMSKMVVDGSDHSPAFDFPIAGGLTPVKRGDADVFTYEDASSNSDNESIRREARKGRFGSTGFGELVNSETPHEVVPTPSSQVRLNQDCTDASTSLTNVRITPPSGGEEDGRRLGAKRDQRSLAFASSDSMRAIAPFHR